MKKIVAATFIFAVYVFSFKFTAPVSAHLFGQPPFFMINGKYSNLYHVPLTSLYNFPLPQDDAPSTYLVNQTLKMGFDVSRLPAPPDVVKKTQFTWDFGDGTKGSGLDESHTFKKPGSYLISIDAFDGTTPTPQLLESVLVNILPYSSYQLPKAVITINSRQSKDPLTDILHFPLNNQSLIHFDAGASTTDPSSKIVSYFWDFGDQKSSSSPQDTHTYISNTTQVFPVLRVKDSNGFIGDQFVELENNPTVSGGTLVEIPAKSQASKDGSTSLVPFILGGLALLALVGFRFKKRKKA